MAKEANNKWMEIVEKLRTEKKMSKTEMAKHLTSRTKYYEHLEAKSVKIEEIEKYLKILGYRLVIAKDI